MVKKIEDELNRIDLELNGRNLEKFKVDLIQTT